MISRAEIDGYSDELNQYVSVEALKNNIITELANGKDVICHLPV